MTTVFVKAKSLFASKTFWLGVAQILAGLVEIVDLIQLNVFAGNGGGWAAVISGVITIGLRWVTKQPVSVSGKDAKPAPAPVGAGTRTL